MSIYYVPMAEKYTWPLTPTSLGILVGAYMRQPDPIMAWRHNVVRVDGRLEGITQLQEAWSLVKETPPGRHRCPILLIALGQDQCTEALIKDTGPVGLCGVFLTILRIDAL